MKPVRFRFHVAETVQQAVELLAREGEDAKILAGGQSLIPLMNFRLASPSALVDVCHIAESDRIALDTDGLSFGSSVRHNQALKSQVVSQASPLVRKALRWVGHEAIRNRGTLAGSTAHADPAAELPAVWLALDARMTAGSVRGTRTIQAEDFFVSYFTTVLLPDEMLTEIHVPHAPEPRRRRTAFREFARRHGDFAIAGAAVVVDTNEDGQITNARIAVLGVADVPLRLKSAEAILLGAHIDDVAAYQAVEEEVRATVRPVGDDSAPSDYRRKLTATLVRRALMACSNDDVEGGNA